jgi:hypothetical protein
VLTATSCRSPVAEAARYAPQPMESSPLHNPRWGSLRIRHHTVRPTIDPSLSNRPRQQSHPLPSNAQIHRARAGALDEAINTVCARSGAIASWAAVSVNVILRPFATHTQTATAVTLTCWFICPTPPCGVAH